MTKITCNSDTFNYKSTYKRAINTSYNCRIALWHLPYDKRFSKFDTDDSKWLEYNNLNNENEIENLENTLHTRLNKYKTFTESTEYEDNTLIEESKYPNGNKIKVNKGLNHVFVEIRDKSGKIVAEKCYNYDCNEGRKTIYKHYTQGDDTFTIVRVFSYDTTKNPSSDIVNYGYTSLESKLTNGCTLEKEYYLLNGKEVKVKQTDGYEYKVKNSKGKITTFTAD